MIQKYENVYIKDIGVKVINTDRMYTNYTIVKHYLCISIKEEFLTDWICF